jgi:hypothetical protein
MENSKPTSEQVEQRTIKYFQKEGDEIEAMAGAEKN